MVVASYNGRPFRPGLRFRLVAFLLLARTRTLKRYFLNKFLRRVNDKESPLMAVQSSTRSLFSHGHSVRNNPIRNILRESATDKTVGSRTSLQAHDTLKNTNKNKRRVGFLYRFSAVVKAIIADKKSRLFSTVKRELSISQIQTLRSVYK